MLDYHALVRAAESLDPVPETVSRLVAIVANDHWAFSDVEQVISLDQALTGRLLQIANSAWSASLMPIGTVKDAVIRIGIGPTVSFAVGACIGPSFRRALPAFGLSEGELWRHAVASALGAEVLAAMCPVGIPPDAITAALLHDVGKVVLARFLTPDLVAGLAAARSQDGRPVLQAETEVLGVNHAELGGLVARHWRLPDGLADAIAHHHAPDRLQTPLCDVVAIANAAAHLVVPRADAVADSVVPPPGAVARLRLPPQFFERLTSHLGRRLDEALARYELQPTARRAAPSRVDRGPAAGAARS